MSIAIPPLPAGEQEASRLQIDAITTEESSLTRVHRMPFGAEVQPDGKLRFRLFGPAVDSIQLKLADRAEPIPMQRGADGFHEIVTDEAGPGSLYTFVLPDGTSVPDPASRFQPQDVHGPSEVIAPARHLWRDTQWTGNPWRETVLYELHIGTFTPEGTFQAAIDKLDYLAELGITALEIMPIADFPGKRNWGYDGVLLYAPDSTYGRPEDFKAFVEAAHQRGISVLLDVVYNHFGPDGNYIPKYFPDLFTNQHKTNWGDAVNYDEANCTGTREFILHNALYWLEEFHLDGLRLDAVHAIVDGSDYHILDELADRARTLVMSRHLHLILENEHREASRLERDEHGEPVHYTAQWNDDMHHVLHTAATNESVGYYKHYHGQTELLGRALAEGFAFQGDCDPDGKPMGEPCCHLPADAFIAFIQNHDQIGNRAFGERINQIAPEPAIRALAATYLLLPQVPMLFMGEEWCAMQPFPYFCDFEGELAEKVRNGRRNEFSAFPEFQDPKKRDSIPDPGSEDTFRSAKLDWNDLAKPVHNVCLAFYRDLLRVRRERVQPLLARLQGCGGYEVLGTGAVIVRWPLADGGELRLAANLSKEPASGLNAMEGDVLWHEGPAMRGDKLAPWSVHWCVKQP